MTDRRQKRDDAKKCGTLLRIGCDNMVAWTVGRKTVHKMNIEE
jgi:hypothetical protein